MEPVTSGSVALEIDHELIDIVRSEIRGPTIHAEPHPLFTKEEEDLVIQRIRCKLQISEWSIHALKDVSKCLKLDATKVEATINTLRSEASRDKLRSKILCAEGEDEFEIAKQIFETIEKGHLEGQLEEFEKKMTKVKDWNFQLEEYGNTTPLHWAILHGQAEIVHFLCYHRHPKSMFNTFDKFGFRTSYFYILSYLIVPTQRYEMLQRVRSELIHYGAQAGTTHYGMYDEQDLESYGEPFKIYHIIEGPPLCYYVDGCLGNYFTSCHLAVWIAPFEIAKEICTDNTIWDTLTQTGHTIFHLAAWKGRHDILEFITRRAKWKNIASSILNSLDYDRQSPLHLAVLSQNKKCVQVLMRSEVIKVTVRNWKGYTPMEIATVLHSSSRSTITNKDLDRFGATNFDVTSLGAMTRIHPTTLGVWKIQFVQSGMPLNEIEKHVTTLKEIISLFDGLDPEALQKDRQVYVDAANAILVGAALIASASFGAWLQPPLGLTLYYSNEFLVTDPLAPPNTYESFVAIKQHWMIQLFWIFNSLSFFFSIATVIAGADAALPQKGLILKEAVTSVRRGVIWASYLLFVAVLCVIGTFITIGFAILPPIPKYKVNMYCTMAIGLATCGVVLLRFFRKIGSSTPAKSWCPKFLNSCKTTCHGCEYDD